MPLTMHRDVTTVPVSRWCVPCRFHDNAHTTPRVRTRLATDVLEHVLEYRYVMCIPGTCATNKSGSVATAMIRPVSTTYMNKHHIDHALHTCVTHLFDCTVGRDRTNIR